MGRGANSGEWFEARLLVTCLALQDSLFTPLRRPDYQSCCRQSAPHLANLYPDQGVPLRGLCHDGKSRKKIERMLPELQRQGLLDIFSDRQRSSVRLTDLGDRTARALCGLPSLENCAATMLRIKELNNRMVSELILCDPPRAEYDASDEQCEALLRVELKLLPALVRGWVVVHSCGNGTGWYSNTRLGLDEIDTIEPSDVLPALTTGIDDYLDSLNASRERLRQKKIVENDIGLIHLPCCNPPSRKGDKWADLLHDREYWEPTK